MVPGKARSGTTYWMLTPTRGGTHVRMEQSGFRPEEQANYQGANYGSGSSAAWNG